MRKPRIHPLVIFAWIVLHLFNGFEYSCQAASENQCKLFSRRGSSIQGKCENVKNVTISDKNPVEFCSFYRIPFAKPPVKKFRFQKAQMVRLFSAKHKSQVFQRQPPWCAQVLSDEGQEDCLYLNVFTKRGSKSGSNSGLQPVLVWIHGGSFAMGSGLSDNFNPSAFIEEDIVVVSFNYRLDVFGFFPLKPEEPYSMNLGLDDQKVALRWVQKHIRVFGGDPKRVTVMGWSAGAASVNYLLYDKEAEGLFRSAIAMSGSFLSPWAFSSHALEYRQKMCDHYEVESCTLGDILRTSEKTLFHLRTYAGSYILFGTPFPPFIPAPEYPGDQPDLRMRQGPLNDVPLLVGMTSAETRRWKLGEEMNWEQTSIPFANNDPLRMKELVEMLRVVKERSHEEFQEHLAMADMYYGVYKFLELHSRRTKKNLFVYNLDHDLEGGTESAAHGDDLKLLFRNFDPKVCSNVAAGEAMEKQWTNFIKFQNPSLDHSWPSYSQGGGQNVMEIRGSGCITKELEIPTLYDTWNDIYNCLTNFICDKPIPKM